MQKTNFGSFVLVQNRPWFKYTKVLWVTRPLVRKWRWSAPISRRRGRCPLITCTGSKTEPKSMEQCTSSTTYNRKTVVATRVLWNWEAAILKKPRQLLESSVSCFKSAQSWLVSASGLKTSQRLLSMFWGNWYIWDGVSCVFVSLQFWKMLNLQRKIPKLSAWNSE